MSPMLEVVGLEKRFGGLQAIADLSFAVPAQSLTAIIGPNGAGKTTLLNLITGYQRPSAGIIRFGGRQITGLRPYQICRRGIGRTFQIVQPFAEMSVEDNVVTGLLFNRERPNSVKDAREEARGIIERTRLSDKRTLAAGLLSIGEKKKLELARALSTRPKLLLLDEVMGGLSHGDIDDLIAVLQSIHQQGTTLIMIEHVMRAVMALAERVIVVNFGRLLFEGPPLEATRNSEVIDSYLGKPIT